MPSGLWTFKTSMDGISLVKVVFILGYGWQFCDSSSNFPISAAIRAGRDSDGCTIYVGRAFHENDLLPVYKNTVDHHNINFLFINSFKRLIFTGQSNSGQKYRICFVRR